MKKLFLIVLVVFMTQFMFGNETKGGIAAGAPASSDKKEQGWFPSLKLKGLVMLNHVSNISGQDDGLYVNLGGRVDFKLDMLLKKHEWRTHFFINEGFSYTPSDERFVKGNDEMVLDSIYLYHIGKKWGPFISFHGDTNLISGYQNYDNFTTFVYPGNGLDRETGKSVELNGSFAPVIIKEIAGLFYRPLEREWMNIEFLGGVGGYHYMVREGTLEVKEERPETDFVFLQYMDTFHQFGGEASLTFSGKIKKKTEVDYKLWASIFVPFVYTDLDGEDKVVGDLINYEFGATVSLAVAKWLSVDYEFKAEWIPQAKEEWQIRNQIMIALVWDAIKDKRDKKD